MAETKPVPSLKSKSKDFLSIFKILWYFLSFPYNFQQQKFPSLFLLDLDPVNPNADIK